MRSDVSRRVTYLSASSPARPTASAGKAKRLDDPWAHQMEGQVADLKRRIPILKRLIDDCDRMAAELDQEVRNEEDRAKIHDQAHFAYPTYARAARARRDNLQRSAEELTTQLEEARRFLEEVLASSSKKRSSDDSGTAQLAG